MSVFTLHTFEINSVSEQRIGIASDGLAGFPLAPMCVRAPSVSEKRGFVAANPAAIFKEDNVAGVKICGSITKICRNF